MANQVVEVKQLKKENEWLENVNAFYREQLVFAQILQEELEWEIKLLRDKLAQSIEPRESEFHFLKDSTSYRLHEIVARVGKWLVVRLYRVEDEDVVTHMSIIRSQYPEQEHERGYGIIDPVTLERPTWAPEFMTIDEALELLKKTTMK